LAVTLEVKARPDAARCKFVPGQLATGFREIVVGEMSTEGEHWRLEVDDESIPVEYRGGRSHWTWTPGFYAGEVRARLVDLRGGAEHVVRLDVAPSADKLGREHFAEVIAELRREQPEFVLGSEPAMDRMGSLGRLDDPLVAYGRLRNYADEFMVSLGRVLAAPVRALRQERQLLALAQVRRADRRTVFQALRNPELASLLTGREARSSFGAALRLDAPVVEPHVDEAANRCIKGMVAALLRRVVECRERLGLRVDRERESGTRTAMAERWPVREQFLLGLECRLVRALRGPVLSAVSRAEITGAGLNIIAAHPVYARTHRLGWRALGLGFEDGGHDEDLWLPPTWELYERWCFVVVRRLLLECGLRAIETIGEPRADLGWTGVDDHGRRIWLGFQVACATWSAKGEPEFRSLSVTRYPDLVMTVEQGETKRWFVLDAKYRVSRSNVLDAMTSAHVYHDALRWRGQRPERALLLVPAGGGAPWLEEPGFHDEHRVGVIVAGPRSLDGLRGLLQSALSEQGTFAACEPSHRRTLVPLG
jgi:hypothetical protein